MQKCKTAALAASIALALGTTAAFAAAPAATQLPGQGKVVSTGTAPTVGTITSGAQTIGLNSNTVIDWGVSSGATINTGTTAQPGGFNVGSSAALTFDDGGNSVLNVDVSGNPSQIMGALNNTGAGNIYVANTNGVIVGAGAVISAGGEVGLIANTLADPTTFTGVVGPGGSVSYNGTGGDVTVAPGAGIGGAAVMVSGGGTVNIDLGNVNTAALLLVAGLPSDAGYDVAANQFTTSGFSTINANAALNVTGSLPAGASFGFGGLVSGGDITTNGTIDIGNAAVGAIAGGTFTNNGTLTWGNGGSDTPGDVVNNGSITLTGTPDIGGSLTNHGEITGALHVIKSNGFDNDGKVDVNIIQSTGDFTNSGEVTVTTTAAPYPAAISVIDGNFTNSGELTSGSGVSVVGGNFTNTGSVLAGGNVSVTNGSIVNQGAISGTRIVQTLSDASDLSFTAGGDYSITNAGTITSNGELDLYANDDWNGRRTGTANDSTGSISNTGVLQVGDEGDLYLEAHNDASLGGSVQAYNGTKYAVTSAANPMGYLEVNAADWFPPNDGFETTGVATLTADITATGGMWLGGSQIKLMANLSSVDDSTGLPNSVIDIIGGAQQASDYAVRVASGKTITADQIGVDGDRPGDAPNVILQGTLAANSIGLGREWWDGTKNGVSDVFTGPAGGLEMWNDGFDPYLYINATGRVKTAPYLNDANFRYNFLPVTIDDGSPLSLEIDPSNMSGVPVSGLNLLVNSDVMLSSDMTAFVSPVPASAVTGVTNVPNSHLVLQSTGSIETGNGGDFYWPGYIYLGNIAADADGNAQPGTLGLGMITTDGEFNNVLPGDVAGASGIHFITQFPLTLGGDVVTNANAWVNFGTQLLTDAYASGSLAGDFFGGVQGSGTVVNYGPLDSANFHFQAPDATK